MSDKLKQESYSDSAALYAACVSEDSAAYHELWIYLYRIASYMVSNQPGGDALAQDCAQESLIRIYQRIGECRQPHAFRTWSRRIVSHLVIDKLRQQKRLLPLVIEDSDDEKMRPYIMKEGDLTEAIGLEAIGSVELRRAINQAPISGRSRRVVLGRYLDDMLDEILAHTETKLAGRLVRPSHIQVTRSKNIVKLRKWGGLRAFYE